MGNVIYAKNIKRGREKGEMCAKQEVEGKKNRKKGELKGHSKLKRGKKGKTGAQGVNTGMEDEKNIV